MGPIKDPFHENVTTNHMLCVGVVILFIYVMWTELIISENVNEKHHA